MRYIRYASIAIFGLALVLIALANRGVVTLRVLPDELSGFAALNPTYDLPLFVVIYGGILMGLIVGFVWEWIREAGERAAAARTARELASLRAEVQRLKGTQNEGRDEVLALLDRAS
jgi:uncharacterized integral membrane protein